jgi:putative endonuclease
MEVWFVYIIECLDKSLYTGMTNDLESRLTKHLSKKGAKYTRSRGVNKIVHTEKFSSKSEALRREMEIKSWERGKKLELIKSIAKRRKEPNLP